MRFTVTWTDEASSALAKLWLAADPARRKRISRCSDCLEADLGRNAHLKGALLPGHEPARLLATPEDFGLPRMAVLYEVSVDDCLVTVAGLRILEP